MHCMFVLAYLSNIVNDESLAWPNFVHSNPNISLYVYQVNLPNFKLPY